jgi:hypothetical protein
LNDLRRPQLEDFDGALVNPEPPSETRPLREVLQIVAESTASWPETARIALQQALKDAVSTLGSSAVAFVVQLALRGALGSSGAAIPMSIIATLLNMTSAAYYGQAVGGYCGPWGRVCGGLMGCVGSGLLNGLPLLKSTSSDEAIRKSINLMGGWTEGVLREVFKGCSNGWADDLKGVPSVVSIDPEARVPAWDSGALTRTGCNIVFRGGLFEATYGNFNTYAFPNLSDTHKSISDFSFGSLMQSLLRAGVVGIEAFSDTVSKKLFHPQDVKVNHQTRSKDGQTILLEATSRAFFSQLTTVSGNEGSGPYLAALVQTGGEIRSSTTKVAEIGRALGRIDLPADDVRNNV